MHPIWAHFSFRVKQETIKILAASMLFSPFLITIVAIIATDNFHMPFGFIAGAKAQRADPNKVVAFRDAFNNVAMPVLAMHDVIFPADTGAEKAIKTPSANIDLFIRLPSVCYNPHKANNAQINRFGKYYYPANIDISTKYED